MAPPKITLYVDIVSPFGYMAYWITRNSPIFKPVDFTYVPVLLAGVMKACGNLTPLDIKNKDKWIEKERVRYKDTFNVPMAATRPKTFPQPTVNTQRALCAIEMEKPEKLAECIDALYHAFWVQTQTINDAKVIASALAPVLGESDTKAIMEKVSSPDVKKRLSANSDKAFVDGAFGLPWFVATNAKGETDSFWGIDHMGQLVDFLELRRKEGGEGFKALL